MNLWRCPRDGTVLRELVARNVFTKHAGCSKCGIVYVLWGDTITRCVNPLRDVGEKWLYLDEKPARAKPEPPPEKRKGAR